MGIFSADLRRGGQAVERWVERVELERRRMEFGCDVEGRGALNAVEEA